VGETDVSQTTRSPHFAARLGFDIRAKNSLKKIEILSVQDALFGIWDVERHYSGRSPMWR
jgi:hypothetical protein